MSSTKIIDLLNNELSELQAIDVLCLDVEHLTTVTSHMIICSGRSTRHVKAIAENLIEKSKKLNYKPLSQSGIENGEWALIDFGEVVIHVMLPDIRAFYNLEGLWQQPPSSNTVAS